MRQFLLRFSFAGAAGGLYRRRGPGRGAVLVGALLFFFHAAAWAQAPSPADPSIPAPSTTDGSDVEDAAAIDPIDAEKELLRKAALDYDEGRFEAAAERFEEGYRLYKKPAYLFNLGQVQRLRKACAPALAAYDKYLAEAPADDPHRSAALKQKTEMEKCVATTAGPPTTLAATIGAPPATKAEPAATLTAPLVPPEPLKAAGRGWMRPAGLTLTAVGAAATVAAIVAGGVTWHKTGKLSKYETYDTGYDRLLTQQENAKKLTFGLAIGAAAATAVGIPLLLWAPESQKPAATTALTSIGLGYQGRF